MICFERNAEASPQRIKIEDKDGALHIYDLPMKKKNCMYDFLRAFREDKKLTHRDEFSGLEMMTF